METTSISLNIGDILFQLISLAIPIVFIVLIIYFWRASRQKREQLNRIEEKLEQIQKEKK
ncbi:DUF4083 domain-containing protein [Bacillus sp. AGMB 02131]|uniref:DUF4083 domain-containing protein n=1 Tax=Peribacillus faecalis TaxID=2772559 RepID=A0A927CUC0_9BACI|nr:DUF4083 domain-containing protein [Peribacillus faecalis]MBD3107973.1 DUF4083 domain-containing protein [Peribacillus faecalis]